MSATIKSEIWQ